jgi:hypothetical protein
MEEKLKEGYYWVFHPCGYWVISYFDGFYWIDGSDLVDTDYWDNIYPVKLEPPDNTDYRHD